MANLTALNDVVERARAARERTGHWPGSHAEALCNECERLQRALDQRNEQIDGYERQLGIDSAGAERTIGSEIERLRSLQGECPSGTTSEPGLQQARKPGESPALLTSKERLTPERLESYKAVLPYGSALGVGGDALRTLIDEIEACWAERSSRETIAPRSVEGLFTFKHREPGLLAVSPVLGTDKQLTDDELAWAIKCTMESSLYRALVELWERRPAVKSEGSQS